LPFLRWGLREKKPGEVRVNVGLHAHLEDIGGGVAVFYALADDGGSTWWPTRRPARAMPPTSTAGRQRRDLHRRSAGHLQAAAPPAPSATVANNEHLVRSQRLVKGPAEFAGPGTAPDRDQRADVYRADYEKARNPGAYRRRLPRRAKGQEPARGAEPAGAARSG